MPLDRQSSAFLRVPPRSLRFSAVTESSRKESPPASARRTAPERRPAHPRLVLTDRALVTPAWIAPARRRTVRPMTNARRLALAPLLLVAAACLQLTAPTS